MLKNILTRLSWVRDILAENEALKQRLDIESAKVTNILTQTDVRQIMRHNLSLVDLRINGHENPLHGLSENEIKEFELWGSAVQSSRWWGYLLNHVINRQAAKTLAASLHSEKSAWSGAGFVDACLTLREEVERLEAARTVRMRGEDPYEPYNSIQ